jgi:Na+-translocating ferredoxin:NAD+ oxidoreductase subunit B
MSDPYKSLAEALDALPNGFPASPDGAELRILAKLYTPEEATLAAGLTTSIETPDQIMQRLDLVTDRNSVARLLKGMARKGLIGAERTDDGLGFKLLPFVIGIYENQVASIDSELARLFEDYFQQAFGQALRIQPAVHRVIPVQESVRVGMEISPYENATRILDDARAWGVLDCICRKQKALIGEACEHPIDVCMAFGPTEGMFDNSSVVRPLTRLEAQAVLKRAEEAGLVHTVSNSQEGIWYMCNCCTCSCGILRGIKELGIANAVARSSYVNTIDKQLCIDCETCLEYCQFEALEKIDGATCVNVLRCIGCGVCIPTCPEGALSLSLRPESELAPIPVDHAEWEAQRLNLRKFATF